MTDPVQQQAWQRAQDLERAGNFEEAERVIKQHIPDGWPQQSAHLYELRLDRLLAAGDRPGALDAFKRASAWWSFHASCATSGGEGMAYSMQRDDAIAAMKKKLGI